MIFVSDLFSLPIELRIRIVNYISRCLVHGCQYYRLRTHLYCYEHQSWINYVLHLDPISKKVYDILNYPSQLDILQKARQILEDSPYKMSTQRFNYLKFNLRKQITPQQYLEATYNMCTEEPECYLTSEQVLTIIDELKPRSSVFSHMLWPFAVDLFNSAKDFSIQKAGRDPVGYCYYRHYSFLSRIQLATEFIADPYVFMHIHRKIFIKT